MRVSLDYTRCPDNILDLYPENDDDSKIAEKFLSLFSGRDDIPRVKIKAVFRDDSETFVVPAGEMPPYQNFVGLEISVE